MTLKPSLRNLGLALVVAVTAVAAGAHDGHLERRGDSPRGLRGGICTSSGGDRYRIVEAVSLRRAARRDLERLPLRRERLGFMDTIIVVEPEAQVELIPELR